MIYFLAGVGILALWLLVGIVPALILCRVIRRADEIELGDDGDEGEGVLDFVPPPHDIGKSISEVK